MTILMKSEYDVCIIGGAGHVGAPLSIVLADRGMRTLICDINEETISVLSSGNMPFVEEGGETMLKSALAKDMLGFTSDVKDISGIPVVVLTIGTPIDEFHNPVFSLLIRCVDSMLPYLVDGQTII